MLLHARDGAELHSEAAFILGGTELLERKGKQLGHPVHNRPVSLALGVSFAIFPVGVLIVFRTAPLPFPARLLRTRIWHLVTREELFESCEFPLSLAEDLLLFGLSLYPTDSSSAFVFGMPGLPHSWSRRLVTEQMTGSRAFPRSRS
jgi:hypothetical protein